MSRNAFLTCLCLALLMRLPLAFAGPVSHLNGLYLPPPVLPSRSPVSEDAFYLSESEDETTASESASVRDTSTDTEDEGPRPV